MSSDTNAGAAASDAAAQGSFVEEVTGELYRLAQRLGTGQATLDMAFLAYLLRTSRFGFFTFGPVTIDVRMIEDIVERTVQRVDPSIGWVMSDDQARFAETLVKEMRRSGRNRIDELTYLLAFMRTREGLPHRVFSELGVTAEDVENYVRNQQANAVGTTPDIEERLYSPEEAADYLGVHVQTVRAWIRSGRLPAARLAGQRALRIRASDLQSVLEPVNPDDFDQQ
ncbi:MAG: helix-turn-helix domain-containing protein [Dehalococcoidia bacterium]|nr:helix-turn-helix domain-containing protein [Dehalococcoidia bacterium]